MTASSVRISAALVGASPLVGGIIWLMGGLGIECGRALVEIGPVLVIGLYLSLQPLLPGRASKPVLGPRAGMAIGAGLSILGAAILRWDLCDPVMAVTLLVFGPAIIISQGSGDHDDGDVWKGQA